MRIFIQRNFHGVEVLPCLNLGIKKTCINFCFPINSAFVYLISVRNFAFVLLVTIYSIPEKMVNSKTQSEKGNRNNKVQGQVMKIVEQKF